MNNKSLLKTNIYRKPHEKLGEHANQSVKDSFGCHVQNGWYSCDEGYGKVIDRFSPANLIAF